jgi:transglutaminase-like putative cysteine protease/predicted glutamine amidotransferase
VFKIPNLTSDILLLNFDAPSSPSIDINLSSSPVGSHSYGWGLGWYPGNQSSSMVIKDPAARATQVFTDSLTDWSNFRSNIFFCKIRGAESDYNQSETQPFSRSFAGADWLFMHNGDLDKAALTKVYQGDSRLLEPIGTTDSELAFCNLLARLEKHGARTLSDIDPVEIVSWFERFDRFGSADMYLSDGQTVCCFHGTQSPKPLRYARLVPPNNLQSLSSGTVNVVVDNSQDTFRTTLVVTSSQFDNGQWTEMQPGQMIMANRGKIVWNSLNSEPKWTPTAKPMTAVDEPYLSRVLHPGRAPQPKKTPPALSQGSLVQDFVTTPRTITQSMSGRSLSYRMFDVTHSTHYEYSELIEHSTHLFRLMPTDDLVQVVLHSKLSLTAGAEEIQFEDVFGNQSVHCEIATPYKSLTVTATSRVKLFQTPPDDHGVILRQTSIPLIWMPWQRQMMLPYLLPPELPESQLRELTNYAMSFVERNDYNLLRTIEDINTSIYNDFEYVSGSTKNSTTAFEVYASRKGVCQDFANLFICLARLLSLPARYRMGYIYTGANYDNKIQSEASHAWAEVYLPYVGWRGFDPTNGCRANQDHVRVACGRNYIDATPTSGTIYKGGGFETLSVDVKMTEVLE